MTTELKQEKAIQHLISYAQFLAKDVCAGNAEARDILIASAARVFSASRDLKETPEEWLGNEFAQYMKEACIEQIWPPK